MVVHSVIPVFLGGRDGEGTVSGQARQKVNENEVGNKLGMVVHICNPSSEKLR
jgi:hypothetical protein